MNKKGETFFASTLLILNLGVQGYNLYNADVPSKWLPDIEVSPSVNSESYFTPRFYNFHDAPVAAQWDVCSRYIHSRLP